MRIAFMGSPEFAVVALKALHEAGHEIVCVYSQPPKPSGRGNKLTQCAVHKAAIELGLHVRTPAKLRTNTEEHEYFASLNLDVVVVAAYGLMMPMVMLNAPKLGGINIHASLLPRWRGAAPIQAAIMAGDTETGITIMKMDEGLDTGPMFLCRSTPITDSTTAPELHDTLARMGGEMIVECLATMPEPVPQEGESTYVRKLTKESGRIDWSMSAADIHRQIRALNPWPGTFMEYNGEIIKVLEAIPLDDHSGQPAGKIIDKYFNVACGSGVLMLTLVQRAGRKAMAGEDCLRGLPD